MNQSDGKLLRCTECKVIQVHCPQMQTTDSLHPLAFETSAAGVSRTARTASCNPNARPWEFVGNRAGSSTCLKLGPTVKISCTRSSTQSMPYLPRLCEAGRIYRVSKRQGEMGVQTCSSVYRPVDGTRQLCGTHSRHPAQQMLDGWG